MNKEQLQAETYEATSAYITLVIFILGCGYVVYEEEWEKSKKAMLNKLQELHNFYFQKGWDK